MEKMLIYMFGSTWTYAVVKKVIFYLKSTIFFDKINYLNQCYFFKVIKRFVLGDNC